MQTNYKKHLLPLFLAMALLATACADKNTETPSGTADTPTEAVSSEAVSQGAVSQEEPVTPTKSQNQYTGQPITKTDFYLGTVCTVKIYDSADESILTEAFERIAALDLKISSNSNNSEIAAINEGAGKNPVVVSNDTYRLVEQGIAYCDISAGPLDVSIGPITNLWRIGFPDARVPSQQEIDNVLPYVNYKDIVLDAENSTVFLKHENMRLDFGSVAKGFATDEVAAILKKHGVTSALIDLGGNLYALGEKIDGTAWNVGIQKPFGAHGVHIGIVKIRNQTLVTSGLYERYIEQDGIYYHHLLNAQDGYPFVGDLEGVTIICDKSVDGDGYSTTTFAYGLEKGMAFIESLEGFEAIFVTLDKKVYITSGLQGLYNHIDASYTFVE